MEYHENIKNIIATNTKGVHRLFFMVFLRKDCCKTGNWTKPILVKWVWRREVRKSKESQDFQQRKDNVVSPQWRKEEFGIRVEEGEI